MLIYNPVNGTDVHLVYNFQVIFLSHVYLIIPISVFGTRVFGHAALTSGIVNRGDSGYEAWQTSKQQTKMPRFMLEGP